MKILLVHNEYGKRSGEEAVVDKMEEIFRELGHENARLTMSTAEARESLAGKFRAFAAGIHSPAGVRAMREAIRQHRPDVVNVHNLYPFISPAALRECKKAGVPVVMTIHNFRLICPTGLFMRDGGPCELCLQRGDEWGCVRYNCEHSWPKSIAYAARNAVARLRRHYRDCVDYFACITDFQRRKLAEAGFPKEKLLLIPNSIELPLDAPGQAGAPVLPACGYVGFVGRLSREKGIDLIIEAARRNPDIPFRLAGAVADPALVADLPANVELIGFIGGKDLEDFYKGARFMVMASRWYEGFPMSILEAGRHARATIGPDHGGFTEILTLRESRMDNGELANAQSSKVTMDNELREETDQQAGRTGAPACPGTASLLFRPGDVDGLAAIIRQLWDDPELSTRLGREAYEKVRDQYSTPVVAARWQKLLSSL